MYQDASFELSNRTIWWFSIFTLVRGDPFDLGAVWALPQGDGLVTNCFQSVFLERYGTYISGQKIPQFFIFSNRRTDTYRKSGNMIKYDDDDSISSTSSSDLCVTALSDAIYVTYMSLSDALSDLCVTSAAWSTRSLLASWWNLTEEYTLQNYDANGPSVWW